MSLTLAEIGELILAIPLIAVLLCSIVLTLKTRFIQLRMLPLMFSLFKKNVTTSKASQTQSASIVTSQKALFAAMSTTIGIGNIVGPAVAVRMGGPGALLGFLVAAFFGASTTFAEVTFAMNFRKKFTDGSFSGGPMHYLAYALGNWASILYAFFGAALLVVWSSNQSNTLADILSSYNIAKPISALFITAAILFYLIGGIKKIGDLASHIVPLMFFLYCGASLWIIFMNAAKLPAIFKLMVTSFFSFKSVAGAGVGFSLQKMLRWGLAKGTQASEAGVGTATIPHTQSNTTQSFEQGILSMISIYSVGFVCLLSGLVTLVSGSWNNPLIPLGINLITAPITTYFSCGKIILALSATLFAFGTILGNAYNGSQCFLFITKNRFANLYYLIVGLSVFLGCLFEADLIWAISDYFIVPVALINIAGIMYLSFKRGELLSNKE